MQRKKRPARIQAVRASLSILQKLLEHQQFWHRSRTRLHHLGAGVGLTGWFAHGLPHANHCCNEQQLSGISTSSSLEIYHQRIPASKSLAVAILERPRTETTNAELEATGVSLHVLAPPHLGVC